MVNGFVIRYRNESGVDGLPGQEGTFLPCSLWLVSCLASLGRSEEALVIFERVRAVANDVGLFSEEYDTSRGRLVGNFPQAFTHVAFINAARVPGRRARRKARPAAPVANRPAPRLSPVTGPDRPAV